MASLREVLDVISPEPVRALAATRASVPVTEVVILDADDHDRLAEGQIVLAAGLVGTGGAARDLVRAAGDAGVAAVVLRLGSERADTALTTEAAEAGVALLAARPGLGWESVYSLLHATVAAADDAPSPALVAGDLFGVADAVEAMVGGSTVIYDRSHRVLAHSASEDDVDTVRRETILGRRTPADWVRRFTLDDSAYRTIRNPGQVVRVEGYAGLRTRLRVAVSAGEEILGEISIAEGRRPLGPEAAAALQRAARLVTPHLLRHRIAEVDERTVRWTALRALFAGTGPVELHAAQLGLDPRASYAAVALRADNTSAVGHDQTRSTFDEHVLHFLSLCIIGFQPRASVFFDGIHLALVPTASAAAHDRLVALVRTATSELRQPGIVVRAAVSDVVDGLEGISHARRQLDVLLDVETEDGVATAAERWHDLALHTILGATRELRKEPCAPVRKLIAHDRRHQSDLVHTLRVYLDAFGSVSATARELTVHPNTLRHRLQRITEVSGLELEDPVQRIVAELDLRLFATPDGEA